MPSLEGADQRLLAELIRERLGLELSDGQRTIVRRKLLPRLHVLGLQSFADYEMLLRFLPPGAEEWEHLAETLTVHETYFFRQSPQLHAISAEILPILRRQKAHTRRLALWSAACSTGEEAYTLSILLLRSGLFPDWDLRVYGSDISRRCIGTARLGVYGPSSFRDTPAAALVPYLEPSEQPGTPRYSVSTELRTLCHFGQQNLMASGSFPPFAPVDLIMCRNLLIYMDERARRHVIDLFYERLLPGGLLLLGHAESLLHISTDFEFLHLDGDLVYKKPEA